MINNQLEEMRKNLYPCKNLPLKIGRRKNKTKWVRY